MITLENIPNHLKNLDSESWSELFNLLPEIENDNYFGNKTDRNNSNGGFSYPYWSESEVVKKFVYAIMNMDLIPVFNWVDWQEGKDIIADAKFDYSKLDEITLCKLFTVIIRSDRFLDGFLIDCFEKKIIYQIIKALKSKVN